MRSHTNAAGKYRDCFLFVLTIVAAGHSLHAKEPGTELRRTLHAWRISVNAQMPSPNPVFGKKLLPRRSE